MSIPSATQFSILLRDQNKCVVCRRGTEDGIELNINHITPKEAGGLDSIHNSRTLCFDCVQLSQSRSKLTYAPLKKHSRIPAEYAMGILKQAMKNYRSKYLNGEISLEEAVNISNSREYVKGINPLFSPLPRSAILAAAIVLHHEGKIKMVGRMLKF
jgi:hypothetical protein